MKYGIYKVTEVDEYVNKVTLEAIFNGFISIEKAEDVIKRYFNARPLNITEEDKEKYASTIVENYDRKDEILVIIPELQYYTMASVNEKEEEAKQEFKTNEEF